MGPGRSRVKFARVVSGIGLATALLGSSPDSRADETPATRDGFIVLPFVNSSPVKQLDWMASALALSTASKLEHLST